MNYLKEHTCIRVKPKALSTCCFAKLETVLGIFSVLSDELGSLTTISRKKDIQIIK